MGRKVHPVGFRISVIRDWQAKWYADKHYVEFLQEDLKLRRAIQSKYAEAGISAVEIDREANKVLVTIYTARPGIVIGRGGQRVDEVRQYLEELIGKRVQLNILEIQQAELDAYLVARSVAEQIERRVAYRRAMKQSIFRTMQAGAKGMKISCAGRLAGVEIARRETMHQGQVPLHTLRADIDYGFTEAHTTLGRIGVKVWIYKGDILPEPKVVEAEEEPAVLAVGEGAIVEPAVAAEPTEELAEPVAAKSAEVAEPEPVTAKGVEPAPSVEIEEKLKKPTRRKKKVEATVSPSVEIEEKAKKPTGRKKKVEATVSPSVEIEEKAKKPTGRKKKVEATVSPSVEIEEKPKKPTGRKKKVEATVSPSVEIEEKPKKPTGRKKKVEDADSTSVELEGQDATT